MKEGVVVCLVIVISFCYVTGGSAGTACTAALRYQIYIGSACDAPPSKDHGDLFFPDTDLVRGKNLTTPSFWGSIPHLPPLPEHMKLPVSEILARFSEDQDENVAMSIDSCQRPPVKEEQRSCWASWDGITHFSMSGLRKTFVRPLTTFGGIKTSTQYTIVHVENPSVGGMAVCHRLVFPVPLFYCHLAPDTTPHRVQLMGSDGALLQAIVVCHHQTKYWSANHVAFKILQTKPGSNITVCHILPHSDIAWI